MSKPKLILEYDGTFSRPDASGKRSGKTQGPLSRAAVFPYDEETGYGEPGSYGNSAGPSHRAPTPDDSTWEVQADKRPWEDEEVNEILGSPILLAKDSGPSPTLPGMAMGWAESPPKDWDEESEIEGKLISLQLLPTLDMIDPDENDGPNDVLVVSQDPTFANGLGKMRMSPKNILKPDGPSPWDSAAEAYDKAWRKRT